ncbi:MAG: glucose-6-phosphate isomerase [Gemmataceae bacterium]|nr:glucose-6-phosphate isomerase [Gemmataceae bacterium]
MQLPDEAITYQYQSLLNPAIEEWTPLAEMRAKHLLPPARIKALSQHVMQIRSQVAAEREMQVAPPEMKPLEPGFIDLPQRLLDQHRRKGDASDLGKIINKAGRLRDLVDRVIILGIGGSSLPARALFEALGHTFHNELPAKSRLGVPRIYFEGNNADNDTIQDLLELLENACVDPDIREERWGMIVISRSGSTLETLAAHRIMRNELTKYYGPSSDMLKDVIVPITGSSGKLFDLSKSYGYTEEDVLTIPDNIGSRYSTFTAVGLLPAAIMGLDVRAFLLGAAAMTRRFLEEPFERNPVLQYALVNYLMAEEAGKPVRVMAMWSKKLESLGHWYDHVLSESLGKHGRGPTPLTMVQTRDLHTRGQQLQEGLRDRVVNNVTLKTPRTPPIMMGMQDHNQDELNALNRKSFPDIMSASLRGTTQAYTETARPVAEIAIPVLNEHTMGQLMQMLMLATVIEGRLMGINPYGQPGVEVYKKHMRQALKS